MYKHSSTQNTMPSQQYLYLLDLNICLKGVHIVTHILVIIFISAGIWINYYLHVTSAMHFNLVLIINYIKYILQIHCLLGASTKEISFPRAGMSKVFNMKLNGHKPNQITNRMIS
jgi:hypothetical protein